MYEKYVSIIMITIIFPCVTGRNRLWQCGTNEYILFQEILLKVHTISKCIGNLNILLNSYLVKPAAFAYA